MSLDNAEEIMIQYLLLKVQQKDWHGVSDAANDLREMQAKKEKNSEYLTKSEQEPVAWHYPNGKADQCTTDKKFAEMDPPWTPMYHKTD